MLFPLPLACSRAAMTGCSLASSVTSQTVSPVAPLTRPEFGDEEARGLVGERVRFVDERVAGQQGAELAEVIVDAESAKSLDRPGMERLLALVDARGVDVVIIAKLDRLTCSVKDLAELLERFNRRGVSLVSVAESLDTGSAAGRLVLNIMTAVSQWEREAIGERTRDAMQHMKASGSRVGNIAFGYRLAGDGRMLEEDVSEQDILTRMRELKASGHTMREIADELNRQGYRTRRGTAWRFQNVADALKAAA